MTKYKWSYVARGHYSTQDGDWTVHVLDGGAVYKTHPTRATSDVTGSKADRYIESVPPKFRVRGKKRVKPDEPEPEEERAPSVEETTKSAKKPKKKATKKQIGAAAKKLAKGAGAIIGATRAFVTEVGEVEERAYTKRKAPPHKKKPEPTARRKAPTQMTEHPLEYLISGAGALPPTSRRPPAKRRREQTLEEFMGF